LEVEIVSLGDLGEGKEWSKEIKANSNNNKITEI
jgi:hypothetical protein